MRDKTKQRTPQKTKINAIMCTLLFVCAVSLVFGLFMLADVFYDQRHDLPECINGVIDAEGRYPEDLDSLFYPKAGVELYYNQWIITDNLDSRPDAYLSRGQKWTGLEVDGKKLPKEGYASYRYYVKNLNAVNGVNLRFDKTNISARIYLNGQLISQSGVVSKVKGESTNTSYVDYKYNEVSPEGFEIVWEVGYNEEGGTTEVVGLLLKEETSVINYLIHEYSDFLLGLFIAIIILSAGLTFAMKRGKADLSTLLLSICTFLFFLCSKDYFQNFSKANIFDHNLWQYFSLISGSIMLIAFQYFLYKNGSFKSIKPICIMSVFLVFLNVLNYLLRAYMWRQIIIIGIFIYLICTSYAIFASHKTTVFSKIIQHLLLYLYFTLVLMQFADIYQFTIIGTDIIYSLGVSVLLVALQVIVLFKINQRNLLAIKAVSFEKELAEVKTQNLRAQIKPHFIFNILTTIQDLYHQNTQKGDEALVKFSKHLRLNVDSNEFTLIPFVQEIENIENYFNLENLRYNGHLNLYLDLECLEFDVPILSLQPLVENAIKHSGITNIDDGYISIKSYEDYQNYYIEVEDNGCGIDKSKINSTSVGIKNVSKRFEYDCKATVKIDALSSGGTIVIITIPKEDTTT